MQGVTKALNKVMASMDLEKVTPISSCLLWCTDLVGSMPILNYTLVIIVSFVTKLDSRPF